VECLWECFGGTTTPTGYKLLDGHVGLIYGDSISLARAEAILGGLAEKGFASANIVFGIGSYTYQYVSRDTYGTAIKATWAMINGVAYDLYKDPKTDNGIKKSACGLLRVEFENGHFVLYDRQTQEEESRGLMADVFCNGQMERFESLAPIRARLAAGGRP
jgi:nicotinamide phosphoribosyltransferase